MHRDSNE